MIFLLSWVSKKLLKLKVSLLPKIHVLSGFVVVHGVLDGQLDILCVTGMELSENIIQIIEIT